LGKDGRRGVGWQKRWSLSQYLIKAINFLDSIASMSALGCRGTSAAKAPSVSGGEIIAVALRSPVMAFLGDVARVIIKEVSDWRFQCAANGCSTKESDSDCVLI